MWRCDPTRVMASYFTRFLDHTQRRKTLSRTPMDEWSASRRDLYLTTHNNHNRQTSMPPAGFEPTISAGERPQTYATDRAATGTGFCWFTLHNYITMHRTKHIKSHSYKTCKNRTYIHLKMAISLIWVSHSEDKGFNRDSKLGTAYNRVALD